MSAVSVDALTDLTAAPDADIERQLAAVSAKADVDRQLQAMKDANPAARPPAADRGGSASEGWLSIGQSTPQP